MAAIGKWSDRYGVLSLITDEATVQTAYRANVDNQCDTGHSTPPTPPAAKAE
jgi:hypothetical protein